MSEKVYSQDYIDELRQRLHGINPKQANNKRNWNRWDKYNSGTGETEKLVNSLI